MCTVCPTEKSHTFDQQKPLSEMHLFWTNMTAIMAIWLQMKIIFGNRKNITKRQGIDPYVSEAQATARSGYVVRAPPPASILIQQQRSFTDFLF